MTPSTRATMLAQIKYHEGLRLRPYRDTKGIWTVGYGHNMEVDPLIQGNGALRARLHANGCTKAEAHAWLADDVEKAIRALIEHLPWCNGLDEVRQAVMVELCFNMGIGYPPGVHAQYPKGKGLRSFVNTLALVRQGKYQEAAFKLLWLDAAGTTATKWHRDVKSGRAMRISLEMRSGAWPVPPVGPTA